MYAFFILQCSVVAEMDEDTVEAMRREEMIKKGSYTLWRLLPCLID